MVMCFKGRLKLSRAVSKWNRKNDDVTKLGVNNWSLLVTVKKI